MLIFLLVLFFLTALLYASVGFGGGSTYNALLVLAGTDYLILPAIALICNIIVVTGGAWRFAKIGHLKLERLTPFILASVPAALLGGRIPVSETLFIGLLGLSLLLAGVFMVLDRRPVDLQELKHVPLAIAASIGGGIGFLSGMVGIGGGIFLAPFLYLLSWGRPKEIAGTCSAFILVNSLSGLAGQILKLDDLDALSGLADHWMLFPAVLIGGQIGSHLATLNLNEQVIKRLTAVLILYVSIRLLWRWVTLVT